MFSMQCFQATQSLSNISAARPKPRQLSTTKTASGSSDSAAMGNQVGAMCNKQSHAANQEQSEMATYQVQNQSSNHQQGQNMLPTNQVIDLTKHLSDNPEWYSLAWGAPPQAVPAGSGSPGPGSQDGRPVDSVANTAPRVGLMAQKSAGIQTGEPPPWIPTAWGTTTQDPCRQESGKKKFCEPNLSASAPSAFNFSMLSTKCFQFQHAQHQVLSISACSAPSAFKFSIQCLLSM